MNRQPRSIIVAALVLVAIALFAGMAQAADEKTPWYQSFNGHEMWLENIDSAFAMSKAANKPLLIDFFQPG
ncbi:MAG: hypothetical protein AB1792_02270 [Candidatus Zixiibacteriota bacterium]